MASSIQITRPVCETCGKEITMWLERRTLFCIDCGKETDLVFPLHNVEQPSAEKKKQLPSCPTCKCGAMWLVEREAKLGPNSAHVATPVGEVGGRLVIADCCLQLWWKNCERKEKSSAK